MGELIKTARRPDFKSFDGVAVWLNTDKNGDQYATVSILGSIRITCFPPKQE